MSVILGFNAFHADSAACLVVDGQLVGAVAVITLTCCQRSFGRWRLSICRRASNAYSNWAAATAVWPIR